MKHRLPGWKLLHESRPHSAHKKRLFGGITVLWQSEKMRVCRESGFPKGVLSFVVQDVAALRKPVAVVALYNPPASSKFNRFGKHWSQDIMTFAEEEVHRLRALFDFVVSGGDYNWRLGSSYRRRIEDVVGNSAAARTKQAQEWHLRSGLRPLYVLASCMSSCRPCKTSIASPSYQWKTRQDKKETSASYAQRHGYRPWGFSTPPQPHTSRFTC